MASPNLARRALSALAALALALSLLGTAAPAAWAQAAGGAAQALATEWQTIGTCEWRVDESGCLTIRPADGVSGEFDLSEESSYNLWTNENVRESITSAVVEEGVSAVGSLAGMFWGCGSLESVDLSGLDTSAVTDMFGMFYYCSSLTSVDFSGFDTSSVTDMYMMFLWCSSLTSLDLSMFDMSNVTQTWQMFLYCTSLEVLDLSGWDTANDINANSMFNQCPSLRIVALGERTAGIASWLPTPSAEFIEGADGLWHTLSGGAYLPEDIPTGAADVYYAVASEVGSYAPASERFSDVDYSGATEWGWAATWVTQAARLGLMTGYRDSVTQEPTGEFGPEDPLTRGQAAVVLYRAMTGAPDDEEWGENATPSVEPDVVEPNYYTNALNWAYANGVMTGDTDPATGAALNTLRPNDHVSRQELAIMVWRASGEPEAADGGAAYAACADAGSEWAEATAALRWTASVDVLSGSDLGDVKYFNASDDALRAHAAKVFVQALGYLAG